MRTTQLAYPQMPLTDAEIRSAKATDKPQKLFDGNGLFLLIPTSGGPTARSTRPPKWWRLKYRFGGKEKLLSLGTYPEVSLKDARERRDAARKLLADGVDPGDVRKAEKRTARLNAENSFEAIAREWHTKFSLELSESHASRNLRRLEVHAFPWLGGRPIASIEPPDVLDILQRIERKGTIETAHRVRVLVGQVMRYAIATGRATRDVTADLRGAIPPAKVKHHAAVTDPKQLGGLLRAIDGYAGTAVVTAALKLAPLVFQRPGKELRQAEWIEFDLDGGLWTIPSVRMKRRKSEKEHGPPHLVPLSTQAIAILRDLQSITGNGRYVFPSARGPSRPMSDMALSGAFKRMGIDADTAVPHGWRATLRTLAVEQLGFPIEAVELQLAHGVRDALGRAYNRVQWLDQRRDLMQRWADYLDGLKAKP